MEKRGRSRKHPARKGWKQRLSSWTAIMLTVAMIFNMPISWNGLSLGISNAYASASDAKRQGDDGLWATASNASYKQGKESPVDIYVIAEDTEVTPGSYSMLTLYLKNNTEQEITDGSLKYKGKYIGKEDGIFTDLHEEVLPNKTVLNDEFAAESEADSEDKFAVEDEVEAEQEENNEIETENQEEKNFDTEIEREETVSKDNMDEDEAEEDALEGETEEDFHVLTDICLKPGELYKVQFEFYTDEEEEARRANVKFSFSGEGAEDGKKYGGTERFYYGINLPYIHVELADGTKLEKQGSHEMEIWMTEPSWEASEEEIEIKVNKTASSSDAEASPSDAQKTDQNTIDQYIEEAMAIKESKISYNVEIFGISYKKFQPQKAKDVENAGWISCIYEFAADAKPGVYYGKVSASGKWNKKSFVSQQGFLFEIVKPDTIELHAELDGMEVIVSGKAEYFPEADELEIQVLELSEEQEQKVAEVLEKKAEEEGIAIPFYKAMDIRLLADGEEAEPTGELHVSFKNMKLVKQETGDGSELEDELDDDSEDDYEEIEQLSLEDDAGTEEDAEVKETEEERSPEKEAEVEEERNEETKEGEEEEKDKKIEAYEISELQETEKEGTVKIFHLDEEENIVNEMESTTNEDGLVVMKTDHFSLFIGTFALDGAALFAATPPSTAGTVSGLSVDGIKIAMYDYDETVNTNTTLGKKGYNFYQKKYGGLNSSQSSIDGAGIKNIMDPDMLNQLTSDGYPKMKINGTTYSMRQLFDTTYKVNTDREPITNGGHLFRKMSDADGGYYYYDSAKNAAFFNRSLNRFTLYNFVIRPKASSLLDDANDVKDADFYSKEENRKKRSNFLPFNTVRGKNKDGSYNYEKYLIWDDDTNLNPRTAKLKNNTNLWFGMTMEFDFYMPEGGKINGNDMIFEFEGDDDVFVYIDNYLVLDIGGTHGALKGDINFATGVVHDQENIGTAQESKYQERERTLKEIFANDMTQQMSENGETFDNFTKHTLKFFYMERGGNISYCRLKFNMEPLPDKSLTVSKELVTDASDTTVDYIKDTLTYKFRVVEADSAGNATNTPYVGEGKTYTILENGNSTSKTGEVGEDGYFELKAGQGALFKNMLNMNGNTSKNNYIIEEILPDGTKGQYNGVEYAVSEEGGTIITESKGQDTFTAYQTKVLSAENTQVVTFKNKVDVSKLGTLKITKESAYGAVFDADQEFDMQIKLGNKPLEKGTKYQVDGSGLPETKEVGDNGVIKLKIGETATILKQMLSGTHYEVVELGTETGQFYAKYSGTVQTGSAAQPETVYTNADSASGDFPLSSIIHVTVTNTNFDFIGKIPIYKQCIGSEESSTFNFAIEEVKHENGEWVSTGLPLPGSSITVTGNMLVQGEIVVGYKGSAAGSYYYKISEINDGGEFIYDDTFYIVRMNVKQSSGGRFVAEFDSSFILKNGEGEPVDKDNGVKFVNYKKVNLQVRKTIEGDFLSQEEFPFIVEIKQNNEIIKLPKPDEQAKYSINGDGTVGFKLKHGETVTIPVPVGSSVTITEAEHSGYHVFVYYTIEDEEQEGINGDTVTFTASGEIEVDFTNSQGAVLPDTGGPGLLMFNRYGWMLLLIALMMAGLEIQFYGERRYKKPENLQKEESTGAS